MEAVEIEVVLAELRQCRFSLDKEEERRLVEPEEAEEEG